jgi:hypothetical protein
MFHMAVTVSHTDDQLAYITGRMVMLLLCSVACCSVLSVGCFGWCKRQCGPLMALARTIRHRRISGWDLFLTDAVRTCVQSRKAHSLHCSSVLFTSSPGASRVQLCNQHGSSARINGQVYFSNFQLRFCRHVCWQQAAAF